MPKLFRKMYRFVCAMANVPARVDYTTPSLDNIIKDAELEMWEFEKIFYRLYLNGTNMVLTKGPWEIGRISSNDVLATFRLKDVGKASFVIDQLINTVLKYRDEVNMVDVYYFMYQYAKGKNK